MIGNRIPLASFSPFSFLVLSLIFVRTVAEMELHQIQDTHIYSYLSTSKFSTLLFIFEKTKTLEFFDQRPVFDLPNIEEINRNFVYFFSFKRMTY